MGSGRPDPYHVLVSELMLQQTQVTTVMDYFRRFIDEFPTAAALADADEQRVLRLWQGLGYYSRARHLHQAARRIVADFAGQVPSDAEQLRTLPGVGRYTAGAVASIAFGRREPILDGNVTRVLCRLDGIEADPRKNTVQNQLWSRAANILPATRVGDFNSALMDLGATICTPRNPRCEICPIRKSCRACQMGRQDVIPRPKSRGATPIVQRWTYCIEHAGRWLIQQRPVSGRWGGLWQFVTLDRPMQGGCVRFPSVGSRQSQAALVLGISHAEPIGRIRHALSHRRYEFNVVRCRLAGKRPRSTAELKWIRLFELDAYPLSRPQLRAAAMLNGLSGVTKRARSPYDAISA